MPTKVAHVVLAARDPQVSAAFYTDVLGMQRVWDFDKLDMVFFSFGERDHDIALIKAPDHAPLGNQGFSHVAFEVGRRRRGRVTTLISSTARLWERRRAESGPRLE